MIVNGIGEALTLIFVGGNVVTLGSSSGMFRRFLPTANREWRCRVTGRDCKTSCVTSRMKK
jgi:hypothetical protein